ncbi:MAG: hypothetical protein ASARMPRED_006963 [Alectoria sarmentosa]|nr:MAG: hypothetical protein ASARMPRED_006963 [Alectoria sarmentosa]
MTARNVVILLISTLLPPEQAAKLILHVWYSARLTPRMIQSLEGHVRRFIAEGVEKCRAISEADQMQSMEWNFDSRAVRISLRSWQWEHILKILDSRPLLNDAERRRKQVVLAETDVDTRDRQYNLLRPSERVSVHKLQKTGVLLPFGFGVNEYDYHLFGLLHPNPTMYDPDTGAWLQRPLYEAKSSWNRAQILTSGARHGVPKEDINGHTYFHVLDTLTAFCKKLRSLNVHFYMYSVNPVSLPELLEKTTTISSFDRIDASRLADIRNPAAQTKDGTSVLKITLLALGRLLKTPVQNPYAVLITLFSNATEHAFKALGEDYAKVAQEHNMKRVAKFMDWNQNMSSPYYLKFMDACIVFQDYDMLFEKYMDMIGLVEVGDRQGMKMKEPNSVIESWPHRMKKRAVEKGAQAEFEAVLASFTLGEGRYVEWVRKILN